MLEPSQPSRSPEIKKALDEAREGARESIDLAENEHAKALEGALGSPEVVKCLHEISELSQKNQLAILTHLLKDLKPEDSLHTYAVADPDEPKKRLATLQYIDYGRQPELPIESDQSDELVELTDDILLELLHGTLSTTSLPSREERPLIQDHMLRFILKVPAEAQDKLEGLKDEILAFVQERADASGIELKEHSFRKSCFTQVDYLNEVARPANNRQMMSGPVEADSD